MNVAVEDDGRAEDAERRPPRTAGSEQARVDRRAVGSELEADEQDEQDGATTASAARAGPPSPRPADRHQEAR